MESHELEIREWSLRERMPLMDDIWNFPLRPPKMYIKSISRIIFPLNLFSALCLCVYIMSWDYMVGQDFRSFNLGFGLLHASFCSLNYMKMVHISDRPRNIFDRASEFQVCAFNLSARTISYRRKCASASVILW